MHFWISLLVVVLFLSPVYAQEASSPRSQRSIDGDVITIPLGDSLIRLDGDLSDWENLPHYRVDYGLLPSPVAGENDSFEFAAAADDGYLYLSMTTPDHVLVAGEHGGNLWNEDSFEFYLNLTDELAATDYDFGIFQIILSPQTIGNSDPGDIVYTGLWSDTAEVKAYVFPTEEGWGCEVGVAWQAFDYRPVEGARIGFNAVLNGATQPHGNRDAKLIWSRRDLRDTSWFDPSVFGAGVFEPLGTPQQDTDTP